MRGESLLTSTTCGQEQSLEPRPPKWSGHPLRGCLQQNTPSRPSASSCAGCLLFTKKARGTPRKRPLSWSRSQGLFAGVALEGATLRQDPDDNATLDGKKLENRDIVTSGVRAPKAAARLLGLLNRYSARERVN